MKKRLEDILNALERETVLRLWTFQHADGWSQLQQDGRLRAEIRHIPEEHADLNYAWMQAQMGARIPGYRGGLPIWLYAFPQPGPSQVRRMRTGCPMVLIECAVPRERVLLSDFASWELIMAGDGLLLPDGATEEELDAAYDAWDGAPHPSWNEVFNLRFRSYGKRNGNPCRQPLIVQGCVEEILLKEVINVTKC